MRKNLRTALVLAAAFGTGCLLWNVFVGSTGKVDNSSFAKETIQSFCMDYTDTMNEKWERIQGHSYSADPIGWREGQKHK